jgi:plastocyanin
VHRVWWLLLVLVTQPQAATTFQIVIGPGFVYTPDELEIAPGDTVQFVARQEHPLRSDTDSFLCFEDCAIRFDLPGTYGFFCEVHGGPGTGMSGVIRVRSLTQLFGDGFESVVPVAVRAP